MENNIKFISYQTIEEKRYMINTHGVVFDANANRVVKSHVNSRGYLEITLRCNKEDVKRRRKFMVHRLVAITFIDNPDGYAMINHIDGNKQNPDVTNLEWCDARHNNIHAIETGLRPLGEDLSYTVLSNKSVHKICQLLQDNKRVIDISRELGISSILIQNIKNRTAWTHISKNYDFETSHRIDEKTARKICEYFELGYSIKDVSKLMNLSKYIVKNIRDGATWRDISNEYEFKYTRHFSTDDVHKICQMFEDGKTVNEISDYFKCKKSKLYMIKQKRAWADIVSQYNF